MQPCRRRRHRAVYVGIDRLVVHRIRFLGRAVQVGRNGNLAGGGDDFRKAHAPGPRKAYAPGVSLGADALGAENDVLVAHPHRGFQGAVFPALGIAHETRPLTFGRAGEILRIVGGHRWFETEYLDEGARGLAEAQARVYDAGVVVDQHRIVGQQVGELREHGLADSVAWGICQ